MVEQPIAAVIPNMGGQEAAVAGSQAIVFTATDRELIEERGGQIDKTKTFLEVLKKRPLTPEVENEQSEVKPEINLQELAGRRQEHKKMLKHAALFNPQERVEINNKLPDEYEASPAVDPQPTKPRLSQDNKVAVTEATPQKAENQTEAYTALKQEQDNLNAVKSRVKEYHLKRLFTDKEKEFSELSEKIRQESLTAVKPAGRQWLDAQLTNITLGAAQYKLNLLTALQEIELDHQHKKTIKWLSKTINQLARA